MRHVSASPTRQWPDFAKSTDPGQWVDDPLGDGFSYTTLPLRDDGDAPTLATLVRYRRTGFKRLLDRPRAVVLSVHGWSDYFYNPELAHFYAGQHVAFYALDLRRFGRSLRVEHELPGFVSDLRIYDEELAAALEIIEAEHPGLPLVLHGHSLGGLVLCLWLARTGLSATGLVLNSPWLEFQGTAFLRAPMKGLLEAMARGNPRRKLRLPEVDTYWRSMSAEGEGWWDLHRVWRPMKAFPATAGWLSTVLEGHAVIAKGLALELPIFVATSKRTHFSLQYASDIQSTDSVIDAVQTRARALHLGSLVTLCTIESAMHDVFASAPEPRAEAYRSLSRWLPMALG
ncbi:alpha/beta hydrolase [Glutamicibacter sp. PS]|uniref:alpha/beta hydrolase n=1 Tax=Glutamicibacter sp. PS TaxID=3075634 RepID=UPI00284CFEA4|nr:alpha/beta hydrolase [Glutamicibacter sp. PS]MDR4532787.1 alpha/beta hydrolase [Glutamicibacter sp. PS]